MANGIDGLLHVLGSVIFLALLLSHGSDTDEVGVVVGDELLHQFVDSIHGNHRGNLLHELILILDRYDRLRIDKVIHVFLAVAVRRGLLAVVVSFLQLAEILRAGTLVLSSCETEVAGTLQLAHGGSQTLDVLTFLRHHLQRQGFL